jgi:anti-sigma regulatory factor (Ser/Thr protein kinase)
MAVNVVTIGIPSEPADVAAVRSLAGFIGTILGIAVRCDHAELLTSELVSNAVRVDAGMVTASFRVLDDVLRVEVHDNGGGWPVKARPHPLDENGGRGLLIVDALADAWGADADPDNGTTVWFELRAEAGAGPANGSIGTSAARFDAPLPAT